MTTLNYDDSGFIVGVNRLNDGINNVHDDTQEIIRILLGMQQINDTRLSELTRAVRSATQNTRTQNNRRNDNRNRSNDGGQSQDDSNRGSNGDRSRANNPNRNPNDDRSNNRARNRNRNTDRNRLDPGTDDNPNNDNDDTRSRNRSRRAGNRERDANGRFTGGGDGDGNSGSRGGGGRGMGNIGADTNGVDPLVDSVNEARTLLSPLTRGAGMLGRGVKFSISKMRALKRREPLPDQQDRHNNENEKLLDKIWKAIIRGGGGGGGGRGLLGGLASKIGLGAGAAAGAAGAAGLAAKKLLKKAGGIKGLGVIGSMLGVGSLAMDWNDLDHKGKSEGVGGLVGGGTGAVVGGVLGSALGPIGTVAGAAIGGWLGSEGGEWLGGVASPYVKSWTDSMIRYDLPGKMDRFWQNKMNPVISSFLGFDGMRSWAGNVRNNIDGGFGGADVSAGVTQKANKAADLITKNALTRSSGYCARYVRKGLQEAGYDLKTQAHAYQYNNGALTDAGFSKVDPRTDGLQKGDVMVMPAQGKHKSGHIQVYNGTQWVSDFKQNSVNPWNDVATEDLNATMYRDQRGAMAPSKGGKGRKARSNQAMQYFMSQGWTKEQAAGIVGNIQKESQFDHTVDTGDGGKAYGLAQWHPDRQQDFKNKYGKSIKGSSFEEQLAFIQFELTKGDEQKAGKLLKKTSTAGQAGSVVSQYYERPKKVEAEKAERARIAQQISGGYSAAPTVKQTKKSGVLSLLGATTLNSDFTTAAPAKGYSPLAMPMRPIIDMPAMPKVTQRLDSGSDNKPIMVQSSNDTISQNVSDRGLAHAITGGIGKDRYYG